MQLGNSASSVRHREVRETAALLWFMSRLKLRTRRDERKNYFFAAATLLSSSLQPDINQGNFRAVSAKTGIRLPDNSVRSSLLYNISSGDGVVCPVSHGECNCVNYFEPDTRRRKRILLSRAKTTTAYFCRISRFHGVAPSLVQKNYANNYRARSCHIKCNLIRQRSVNERSKCRDIIFLLAHSQEYIHILSRGVPKNWQSSPLSGAIVGQLLTIPPRCDAIILRLRWSSATGEPGRPADRPGKIRWDWRAAKMAFHTLD